MDDTKREMVKIAFSTLFFENIRYLRRMVFKPYLKILCMRLILFYQRHISRHTCMFRPTCSEYTLRCINNHGAIVGIFLGVCRILRCHPWAEEGKYDPAPENFLKSKWLL